MHFGSFLNALVEKSVLFIEKSVLLYKLSVGK